MRRAPRGTRVDVCARFPADPKGAWTPNKTAQLRQIALISSWISSRENRRCQVCQVSLSRYRPWLCYALGCCSVRRCARVYVAHGDGGYTPRGMACRVGASRVSEFNESEAERKRKREKREKERERERGEQGGRLGRVFQVNFTKP